jgi:hypothetical protein
VKVIGLIPGYLLKSSVLYILSFFSLFGTYIEICLKHFLDKYPQKQSLCFTLKPKVTTFQINKTIFFLFS